MLMRAYYSQNYASIIYLPLMMSDRPLIMQKTSIKGYGWLRTVVQSERKTFLHLAAEKGHIK